MQPREPKTIELVETFLKSDASGTENAGIALDIR